MRSSRLVLLSLALCCVLVLSLAGNAFAAGKDIGGDGRDDAAMLYDYGSGKLGVWAFDSASQGPLLPYATLTPRKLWGSTSGWYGASCDPVLADLTGDGTTDVVIRYAYANATTGIWVVPGGPGTSKPYLVWKSGTGQWNAARTKLTSAEAFGGTGPSNPIALYDYGNGSTGIWVFRPTTSPLPSELSALRFKPALIWKSGVGKFYWSRSKPVGGDFNGDGKGDVAILYDYGNSTSGMWLFLSNGSKYNASLVWKSGVGKWAWSRSKVYAADFNGDGKDDVGLAYDTTPANMPAGRFLWNNWKFISSGTSLKPVLASQGHAWIQLKGLAGADVTGDGQGDLVALMSGSTASQSSLKIWQSPELSSHLGGWSGSSWYTSRSKLIP